MCSLIFRAILARLLPACASSSSLVRRIFTIANSETTKKALQKTNTKTKNKLKTYPYTGLMVIIFELPQYIKHIPYSIICISGLSTILFRWLQFFYALSNISEIIFRKVQNWCLKSEEAALFRHFQF